jgi:hypothetical protein
MIFFPDYRVHDNSDDPEQCCNALSEPAPAALVPARWLSRARVTGAQQHMFM